MDKFLQKLFNICSNAYMKICAYGLVLTGLMLVSLSGDAWAQATRFDEQGNNPNSLHPIPEGDQMYRMAIWRRLNLNLRPNQPFFASGGEITKLIIDAVQQGRLTPYRNDSLTSTMTREEFMDGLKLETAEVVEEPGFGPWEDEPISPEIGADYFLPRELYLLEIREDMIFDRKRSRMYFDILAITVILPADNANNFSGLEKPLGTFRFIDLARVFDENPNAVWYNPQNRSEDKSMTSALELRLFHSNLYKIYNNRDQTFMDMYSQFDPTGLKYAQKAELDFINFESQLWDY